MVTNATSTSMSPFIVSHLVRRELKAERIIASKNYSPLTLRSI
jgi:hypothetical protein